MAGLATFIQSRLFTLIDPGTFPNNYNQLEVWQAADLVWEYGEITAAAAGPAEFLLAPYDRSLDDLTLEFLAQEDIIVPVTFSAVSPLSPEEQATQISAQGLGLIEASIKTIVDENYLSIRTTMSGRSATLRVRDGSAVTAFGLTTLEPDAVRLGKAVRPTVYTGMQSLIFIDQQGSQTYSYKVRYRNSFTAAVSEFSQPFEADTPGGIGVSFLAKGTVKLADLNGAPLVNKEVRIHCRPPFNTVDSRLIANRVLRINTDEQGFAECSLPRGQNISVVVVGTDIVRDLTVPTDPAVTVFDLFDPALGSNDVFKVQRPPVDYATRRS